MTFTKKRWCASVARLFPAGRSALFVLLCLIIVTITGLQSIRPPQKANARGLQPRVASPVVHDPPAVDFGSTAMDTFVIAEFDFEGVSAPDPQGWESVDITEQTGVYWHVDTFMVPTGGGGQAMWCGAQPDTAIELCSYDCLPGYGNNWTQIFETPDAFVVEGDVTWSFIANWDTELNYDELHVEYFNKDNDWVSLDVLDGVAADSTLSYLIAASDLDGSVRLRLRFESDGSNSDEDCGYDSDGAVQLDNIEVADTTGVVHFEDFEDEPLDSRVTDDGVWVASAVPGFGNHAGLLDASTQFLHSPDNDSYVWGFTRNSPSTCDWSYNCSPDCGPDTLHVVPGRGWDYYDPVFANEIWSPVIDWTHDIELNPVDTTATVTLLQFRVYRHLSLEGAIFYSWRIRTILEDESCPNSWEDGLWYYGSQGDWYEFTVDISDLIAPGVDRLQLALGAYDKSPWTCYAIPECGDCLTVSPLFDDVRVVRCKPVETAVEDPQLYQNTLAANYPNPFNPETTIKYSIKERARVSLKIYDVTGRLVRTLVDEVQSPAEIQPVRWDGTNDGGTVVSSGVYFCKLVTKGFTETRKLAFLK